MRIKPVYISYILLAAIIVAYTLGTVQIFGPINSYLADEVWYPTAAYNYLKLIFGIAPNMSSIGYPNENGISTYMNFEHPPLGKYFMAISILVLGYNPLAWRLPSWILGDLLLVVGFFLGEKLYEITTRKRSKSGIPGLLASLLIAIDPTIWVMHGIAMLDIYLAFFSLISLYALLSKHYLWSSILLGLAALSKDPGFILYIPFLFYILKNVKGNSRRILYLLIPIAVYIELSVPLIFYTGTVQWFQNEFSNAVWEAQGGHASFSTSSPLSWFFNPNPFEIASNIVLNVNSVVLLLALGFTIYMLIMRKKEYNTLLFAAFWAWTVYILFVAVFYIGNLPLYNTQGYNGGRALGWWIADVMPVLDVFVASSLLSIMRLEDKA